MTRSSDKDKLDSVSLHGKYEPNKNNIVKYLFPSYAVPSPGQPAVMMAAFQHFLWQVIDVAACHRLL